MCCHAANNPNELCRHVGARWGFLLLSTQAQRPPTSHYDSLGGFLRSPPPTMEQTPQCVEMTHWGLPLTFDTGHNDPQQVILTCWGLGKFFFLFLFVLF